MILRPKKQHSQKAFERITDYEARFISEAYANGTPPCPDCQKGQFLGGPQGGASQNVRCNSCGAEFNLCLWGNLCIGERITDRGTVDHSRDQFYPKE
jgi:hypothetical protein